MGLCHRNSNRQYDVARRLAKNNNAGDDLGLVGDFAGLVAARKGEQITVYKQVFVRENSNAVWKESGTYLGYATVGDYYGGGNNGKSVRTVDAYSWKAGALATSEDAAN